MFRSEELIIPFVMGIVFWTVLTLVETVLKHRRMVLMVRMHEKILDRVSTAEEMAKVLGSGAGQGYLTSFGEETRTPEIRILRAMQAGTVFSCLGVGFLAMGPFLPEAEPGLYLLGGLLLALGIGFALAAYLSHRLSKSFGLYERSGPSSPDA